MTLQAKSRSIILALVALSWVTPSVSQIVPQNTPQSANQQQVSAAEKSSPGSVNGTIVDQSGAAIAGAQVKLVSKDPSLNPGALNLEVTSGTDGQFFFPSVPPGPFQITIASSGFAPQTIAGILQAGEVETLPQITVAVADTLTEVDVGSTQAEVAEEQIKVEEKQRIFGAIPNFYVSYIPDAVPLNPKQKFELALRTVVDPFTVSFVAGIAGVEQAQNHFAGYGQGAQGYGKRLGADYADTVTATFIGEAVLASVLKQDPRYFYKGTGSKTSRALYAIANSVICKGDNRRFQPNYSNVLGTIAAGGISNLYYPAQDRNGASLTFENAALGIGTDAVYNLFQEFFIKKLTPHASKPAQQP